MVVVEVGGLRLAASPINDASSLSLRFPIVSSRKETVGVDADEGDVEAVDRIGEMLAVNGDDKDSRRSCFGVTGCLELSPDDLGAMAIGDECGEAEDGEGERCRCRR